MNGFRSVLVTANVFQNCLPRLKRDVELNIKLLDRFLQQPIRWYVSEVDYQMLRFYWEQFGDPACESAYLGMLARVQPCIVDEGIQAEAQEHAMSSVSDAIRLACAIDRQVDALVTWEPDHFTRSREDHDQVFEQGFFDYHLRTEIVDSPNQMNEKPCIRIFSVRAFAKRLV